MSVQAVVFCSCSGCRAHRSLDPFTGNMFAGQYVSEFTYKQHRQHDNAVRVVTSHLEQIDLGLPHHSPIDHDIALDDDSAEDPGPMSDRDKLFLKRLQDISSKIEQTTDIQHFIKSEQVIFRRPPTARSPPMTEISPELLELEVSCLANVPIIRHERMLQTASQILDNVTASTDTVEVLEFADSCGRLIKSQTKHLLAFKHRQWEDLRRIDIQMPGQIRRVNTTPYIARPYRHIHPFILVCYFIVAFMHLIAMVSLNNCRILLCGLRKLATMATSISANLPNRDFQVDIPRNAESILSFLDIRPKTRAFVCCPKCFCLYAYDPENPGIASPPQRCSYRRTPATSPCNASLVSRTHKPKKSSNNPIRLFLSHELEEWVAELYCRAEIEAHLDREFELEIEDDEIWDIYDSVEFRSFLGPENDPDQPFLKRPGTEGRMVFSLNMDGFNPFSNKESGKKVTVGAIYLVCLTLPASIRFDLENIFLAGIIPGPKEPSKDQINHVLRPLVDDLLELWSPGFFLTSTSKYPHGRLVRGALIPLVCDLPAARQMSGHASHSSHHFCSFCTLDDSQIDNLDPTTWTSRTREEHMKLAAEWRDAGSDGRRAELYEENGVRWSELLRLPYWDPTRFVMIDSMHGFLLGSFQRHCRKIWGMDIKIADVDYPGFANDQHRPSDEVMQSASTIFRRGSADELKKLSAPALRQLARETNTVPYGGRIKKVLAALINYRVTRGWFNQEGELVDDDDVASTSNDVPVPPPQPQPSQPPSNAKQPRRSRNDPPTQDEVSNGLKVLESGPKSKLSDSRRALLVHLCQVKGVHVDSGDVKADLLTKLENWRRLEGIIDENGKLVARPERARQRKATGVLGSQTLKEVRADMERLVLPSWVAPSPRTPGDAGRGKFTADQWRSFCTINLTLTLNRLWGQEPATSRRRKMLDNFMHLVSAVKVGSMRCMTPSRIASYTHHMTAYLENLIELYPNTAITPYQHLALHIPRFLQGFGSVQAWRCFPFERFNFILQNIPTNMKFGDLERTMLVKFCMSQKLRQRLAPKEVPPELEDLVKDWEAIMESGDIRGTRIHEAFDYDQHYKLLGEAVTWKDEDQLPLSPTWWALLNNWIRVHDPVGGQGPPSASAYHRKQVTRLGETYQTEHASFNNSHVYYKEGDAVEAGTIQGIFSHSRRKDLDGRGSVRIQTFFVLKQFQHLPTQFHQYDAYRRFPLVGGRLFREAYYEGETIVAVDDILYHLAYARINIPEIPFPCIAALPLSR